LAMPKRSSFMLKELLAEAQQLGVYDVGETVMRLARRLGKKPSEIVKLNSNENFFVPLDLLREALKEIAAEADPRVYPRDEPKELKESLSRILAVSPDQIVIGTGSDQLIDLVSRMMLRPGDEALSIFPTFSIYERCARIQGAIYKPIPLKEDFSLDVEKLLNAVTSRTRLIFLCSPNNPTANQFSLQSIRFLAESFEGLVAVDEAYVDFAGDSLVRLVEDLENLVVFRTFSKVFGLAGLRVGFAVANLEIARVMDERYQMPYSVSLVGLLMALKLLEKREEIKIAVENVKAERNNLMRQLNSIEGVRVFDSQTNFVLFQVDRSSEQVYRQLLDKGVIVRNIGRVLRYENCLRVTVAPSSMMEKFLTALEEVLG